MKKEVFKILRCKCGKMTRETEVKKDPQPCPRCQKVMTYSADWYIAVTVDGKRRIQKVSRQQRQAESVLKQAHTELFQRKFFPESAETLLLSEAIKQVYERKWKKKKDGAKSQRRADIITETIGDIPLAGLDEKKYYELIALLETRQIKESTINRYRAALKTILRHHKQDYSFIELTPELEGRIRVLTKQEETTVISLFRDTDHPSRRRHYYEMADYTAVLIDTGLRANELLGLPPQDINFSTRLITIWRNKAEKPRSVPMTSRVQQILQRRAAGEKEQLFELDIYQADLAWRWARKEMGLEGDKDFVIHALRHTCATRLIVKGIDIYRVQKWLGHKSIRTTEKYLHLDPSQLAAAAAALEEDTTPPAPLTALQELLTPEMTVTPEQMAAIMQILQVTDSAA